MINRWEFYTRCNKSCVAAGANTPVGIHFCHNVWHVSLAVKAPETGVIQVSLENVLSSIRYLKQVNTAMTEES